MLKSPSEKLATHNDALNPVLEELKQAFVQVVNKGADIAGFTKAVERLNEFREFINSAEDIGFVVGLDHWYVVVFPLTGDPQKDADQIPMNLPKSKVN